MKKKSPAKKTARKQGAAAAVAVAMQHSSPRKAKAAAAPKPAATKTAAAPGGVGRPARYGSPLVVQTGRKTASGKPAKTTKPGCTMIIRLPENWRIAANDLAARTDRTTNAVVLRGLAREFIAAGYPLPTDPPMANPDTAVTG